MIVLKAVDVFVLRRILARNRGSGIVTVSYFGIRVAFVVAGWGINFLSRGALRWLFWRGALLPVKGGGMEAATSGYTAAAAAVVAQEYRTTGMASGEATGLPSGEATGRRSSSGGAGEAGSLAVILR